MIEDCHKIFVVVPCFNETAVIRQTIWGLVEAGFSVVLVDDGSTEDCKNKLIGLPIYYIRHKINLGQGAALQTGIDFALIKGATIIATFDADGQHKVSDIKKMLLKLINEKLDFVFGSRFTNGAFSNVPFTRKILLNISRFINFLVSGVLLSDCNNGLRIFTHNAANRIRIKENRRTHSSDIIYQVVKVGLKYNEFPVTIEYTNYSLQKGIKNSEGIKIFMDILLFKFFK